MNTGERLVIAEVIDDDGEWVDLVVRDCTVATEMPGWKVEPLAKDAQLRRKRSTIERGRPERLLWSDEGVRALLLVNRFLKADNPAPSGDDY